MEFVTTKTNSQSKWNCHLKLYDFVINSAILNAPNISKGYAAVQLVEALSHTPEGRGFDFH
jgi:hypothetical protein